jgi:hypothetical protein
MEEKNADHRSGEQTRLIGELLQQSGLTQDLISRKSEEVSRAFKKIRPDLPRILTAPTLSRMKTGHGLKKLKRRNLQLLHLTITYCKNPRPGDEGNALRVAEEADDFADSVLRAAQGPMLTCFNPNDPRHDRTADLFGGHGIGLLERAISRNDAGAFREIAVLQWISGNLDDARHWNDCASRAAVEVLEALNAEVAAQEVYVLGRQYLFRKQGRIAEVYLALAAEAGHGRAAFLLGEAREELQR